MSMFTMERIFQKNWRIHGAEGCGNVQFHLRERGEGGFCSCSLKKGFVKKCDSKTLLISKKASFKEYAACYCWSLSLIITMPDL